MSSVWYFKHYKGKLGLNYGWHTHFTTTESLLKKTHNTSHGILKEQLCLQKS